MTTTETRKTSETTNGTKAKNARTRKPLTARDVAMKVAALVEKLPSEQREKAINLAKTLIEAS